MWNRGLIPTADMVSHDLSGGLQALCEHSLTVLQLPVLSFTTPQPWKNGYISCKIYFIILTYGSWMLRYTSFLRDNPVSNPAWRNIYTVSGGIALLMGTANYHILTKEMIIIKKSSSNCYREHDTSNSYHRPDSKHLHVCSYDDGLGRSHWL